MLLDFYYFSTKKKIEETLAILWILWNMSKKMLDIFNINLSFFLLKAFLLERIFRFLDFKQFSSLKLKFFREEIWLWEKEKTALKKYTAHYRID